MLILSSSQFDPTAPLTGCLSLSFVLSCMQEASSFVLGALDEATRIHHAHWSCGGIAVHSAGSCFIAGHLASTPDDSRLITPETTPPSIPTNSATGPTALQLDSKVVDHIPYYMLMLDKVRRLENEFDILRSGRFSGDIRPMNARSLGIRSA
jgi:hypothetical protein